MRAVTRDIRVGRTSSTMAAPLAREAIPATTGYIGIRTLSPHNGREYAIAVGRQAPAEWVQTQSPFSVSSKEAVARPDAARSAHPLAQQTFPVSAHLAARTVASGTPAGKDSRTTTVHTAASIRRTDRAPAAAPGQPAVLIGQGGLPCGGSSPERRRWWLRVL